MFEEVIMDGLLIVGAVGGFTAFGLFFLIMMDHLVE